MVGRCLGDDSTHLWQVSGLCLGNNVLRFFNLLKLGSLVNAFAYELHGLLKISLFGCTGWVGA